MKKITFLVSSMEGGGAERVAALLSNHWVKQGHQVTLVATFSGRGNCVYPLDHRVKLCYLADHVSSTKNFFWNKINRLITLRRLIHHQKPNVIVSFLSEVNIAAVLATLGLGIPVVISERNYPPFLPLSFGMKKLREWSYPRATAVVLQTKKGLEWLSSEIPKSKGYIIPNPVAYPLPITEPKLIPDHFIDNEKKLLLAVGRLDKQKGFDYLIETFSRLEKRNPQWDLVILGEGPMRKNLELQIEKVKITHRVHLLGRAGNLSDWYNRSSLFVLSSRFEGFPNVLLEAMSHGLPVVSSDCDTGPSDIINHEVNGHLVPQENRLEALEPVLELLMNDHDLRARLSNAATEVRHRFSLESITKQWNYILGL